MSDPLEGLGIPDALRRSGDPIDGNPYRDSDPLHPIWAEATRNAQRELHDFRSRIIEELPVRSEDFLDWLCRFFAGQFDVWAKRCKYFVWTDKAVDSYDDYLVWYADDLLRLIKDSEKLSFSIEPLRLRLIGRIEFWKSEARRYRAELESRAQQATPPDLENTPPTAKLRSKPGPKSKAQTIAIRELLKQYPDMPARSVCRLLDSKFGTDPKKYPSLTRPKFAGKQYPSWQDAYSDRAAASLIDSLVSRNRPK
jgi:hypothetical protein